MTTSPDLIEDASASSDTSAASSDTSAPSATLGGENKRSIEQIALLLFITVPFLALLAAIPLSWGWG